MVDKLVINASVKKETIDKNIYGHFAEHLGRCIYDGIWVGEDSKIPNIRGIRADIVEALKRIKAPIIRWPGGCFADEYHWRDGVGPASSRRRTVNSHWGGVVETNRFGTHEFFDLCELTGAEPYICGNVGSGTVQEMQEWVEYMNSSDETDMVEMRRRNGRDKPFGIKYFGVGNENWGCGGRMRPEYYADLYKRYQTYVHQYGDYPIYKIACGPKDEDYNWTDVLMRDAKCRMDGLALHYYTRIFSSGENKTERRGFALGFDEADWFSILKYAFETDRLVSTHSAVMDRHDPAKRVSLVIDEWGTWYDVEPGTNPGFLYQQNTIRDALVAGISLNIFNNHCDRVRMANIAQTINVLQAMALTEGEKLVLTPTYHVFEMYKEHQGASLLPSFVDCGTYSFNGEEIPRISCSASSDSAGRVHATLCNADPKTASTVECDIQGLQVSSVAGRALVGERMDSHNSFSDPERVRPVEFSGTRLTGGKLTVSLPPMSVVALEIR